MSEQLSNTGTLALAESGDSAITDRQLHSPYPPYTIDHFRRTLLPETLLCFYTELYQLDKDNK